MLSLKSLSNHPITLIIALLLVVGGVVLYFYAPTFVKEGLADFVAGGEKTAKLYGSEKDAEKTVVNYSQDPIQGADFVAEGVSAPITPEDLLPKSVDANSFDIANPVVGGTPLDAKNFLASGYNIGINTVGNSNRNSNLSLRADPPIPVLPTGPWNQTTILPDLDRKGLDVC
jgi:hypothetical protein